MKNKTATTLRLNYVDALTMFIVSALSICLLLYVAFGEARRTNEQFQSDKLTGQAELIQGTLESYLHAGLPLHQFAGFGQVSQSIMSTDPSISGIAVRDTADNLVFNVGAAQPSPMPLRGVGAGDKMNFNSQHDSIQLNVPLRSKFEKVGTLSISMRKALIDKTVVEAFKPLIVFGLIASLVFAFYTLFLHVEEGQSVYRKLSFVYAGVYLLVAGAVIWSMISVYSGSAQAKAQSVAAVLGARLDDVPQLRLDYSRFVGVSAILNNYRKLNPDVSDVELVSDNKILVRTDNAAVGSNWAPKSGMLLINLPLSKAHAKHVISLMVQIPRSMIYWQIGRNAKNFAALFIASGLIASLFMELGRALREKSAQSRSQGSEPLAGIDSAATRLIKPAYFLAVFVESLSYPVLPHFAQSLAMAQGVPITYATTPFMVYYACFALALIVAISLERRFGPRSLMIAGLLLCALSYVALGIDPTFYVLVVVRAIAGFGQGILFIGVQSFALNLARSNQRTQAASIIVFGFQAGTLAGMAIGSLLVTNLGIEGVFLLAGALALLTCIYTLGIVPDLRMPKGVELAGYAEGGWRETWAIIRDFQFFRSMAFIGVPAKAIMTGVVLFAMPLLLRKSGYALEDIGQLTMVYAACVVIVSHLVSRYVDKSGSAEGILLVGSMLSSVGLFVMGYAGDVAPSALHALSGQSGVVMTTAFIVVGIISLGSAHGLINAPIVTNVANAPIAGRVGAARVAATYRLLERVGHVSGPLLMSQILLLNASTWSALYWVAVAAVVLGMCFIITSDNSNHSGYPAEIR
ncbi:MAG: MFS transporter [Hyphomicrobiales bacterium]|nr:MFS transporter [Hyphomicrobiales bacterium]